MQHCVLWLRADYKHWPRLVYRQQCVVTLLMFHRLARRGTCLPSCLQWLILCESPVFLCGHAQYFSSSWAQLGLSPDVLNLMSEMILQGFLFFFPSFFFFLSFFFYFCATQNRTESLRRKLLIKSQHFIFFFFLSRRARNAIFEAISVHVVMLSCTLPCILCTICDSWHISAEQLEELCVKVEPLVMSFSFRRP